MKGKTFTMHISLKDSKLRNELHFEAQLHNRMIIQEDKTKFNRSRSRKETRKLIKDYL